MGLSKLNHWNSYHKLTSGSDAKNLFPPVNIYIRVRGGTVKALIWRFLWQPCNEQTGYHWSNGWPCESMPCPQNLWKFCERQAQSCGRDHMTYLTLIQAKLIKIISKVSSCQKTGVSITDTYPHVHMWQFNNVAKSSTYSNC